MASLTSPSGLVLSSSGRRAFQQTRVAQMLSTAPFGASNSSASAAHPVSSQIFILNACRRLSLELPMGNHGGFFYGGDIENRSFF
jgi:hypothetical protein